MNKLTIFRKKYMNRTSMPYIVAGILFFVYYMMSQTNQDDLEVIAKYGYVNSLWQHVLLMKEDYLNWSSRIFVNFPIHVLVTKKLIWVVLNTIITLLFMRGIERLVFPEKKEQYRWYIVGIVLLFPWDYLGQSGWIVTSMTYLWPATALLYWMLLLKQYLLEDKLSAWRIAGAILLGIYATNLEQMAVFGTVLVFGFAIYSLLQKKKKPGILIWVGVLVIAYAIHFLVPGESVRYLQEVGKQFPDYLMLNLMNKLDLGIATSMTEFVQQLNFLYLLFAFLLIGAVRKNGREPLYCVIASIPLGFGILWPLSDKLFAGTNYDIGILDVTPTGAITPGNCLAFYGFYYLLAVFVCVISIGMSLLVAFDTLEKGVIMASVFVGAYATRVMMAFSPTIWASGERTYIAMYFAFLVMSAFLLKERLQSEKQPEWNTFDSILSMGVVYSLVCWLV